MSANEKSIGSDLAKVDAYVNTEADYLEVPEVSDEQFARATMNRNGKPVRGRPPIGSASKKLVSLRLDPEIEARFRSSGPGWQRRMNTFLAHNEAVLGMIVDFDELIGDMETLIRQLRQGDLRMAFEPAEASIAKVERNIRNTKETVHGLREQLVWEAAESVD